MLPILGVVDVMINPEHLVKGNSIFNIDTLFQTILVQQIYLLIADFHLAITFLHLNFKIIKFAIKLLFHHLPPRFKFLLFIVLDRVLFRGDGLLVLSIDLSSSILKCHSFLKLRLLVE